MKKSELLLDITTTIERVMTEIAHLSNLYEEHPELNDIQPEGTQEVYAMSLDEWKQALWINLDKWHELSKQEMKKETTEALSQRVKLPPSQ